MDFFRKLTEMELSSKLYRMVVVGTIILIVATLFVKCRISQQSPSETEMIISARNEVFITAFDSGSS